VLVTAGGGEVLTAAVPKSIAELEALIGAESNGHEKSPSAAPRSRPGP